MCSAARLLAYSAVYRKYARRCLWESVCRERSDRFLGYILCNLITEQRPESTCLMSMISKFIIMIESHTHTPKKGTCVCEPISLPNIPIRRSINQRKKRKLVIMIDSCSLQMTKKQKNITLCVQGVINH